MTHNTLHEDLKGMSESRQNKSLGSKTSIIRSAFLKICSDETFKRRLWNKWLPAETWVEALAKSNLIDHLLISSLKIGAFNAAMGRSGGDFDGQMISRFDGTNVTGIFRLIFQRTTFYIVTDKNKQVCYPMPLGDSWKQGVMDIAKNVFCLPATRSSNTRQVLLEQHSDYYHPAAASSKRQRTGNNYDDAFVAVAPHHIVLSPSEQQVLVSRAPVGEHHNTPSTSAVETNVLLEVDESITSFALAWYWNSRDAFNLFGGGGLEVGTPFDDVRDLLKLRIELLQSVNRGESGWRNVIHGRDPENLCSPSDIFAVRGRSMILCLAYQLAIKNMNKWTWEKCCTHACSQLNPLGIEQATHHRAVQDWNGIFRHEGSFPHPNHAVRCGKKPLPLLFEKYPGAIDDIIQFGVKNLTTLTIESFHGFCHEILLPKLFEQWRSDVLRSCESTNVDQDVSLLTKQAFMNEHRIRTLSIPTCWRWLHRLGFRYEYQRKGYYVDGHERSDVVASRKAFCETYLTDVEPRCLRWIRVSQRELETTHKILNPEFGYRFNDANNQSYVEFHVDYCTSKQEGNDAGGERLVFENPSMSIRAPHGSMPVEVFGQDESVFLQFIFPTKSWMGPNQERGLFPKSLGEGLMISAFVSRDSGFGMPVSPAQLEAINRLRYGTDYIDKVAAVSIHLTTCKAPLKESPFVRSLLIGATKGGYWNSYHMAIQLEDAVDCLRILRPGFEFVFLFDHSQGHARKKEGALDASSMSRSYGGAQPKIRNSEITEGCLGPFNPSLRTGDMQSMVYTETDTGPWWITTQEGREARRHDIIHNALPGAAIKLANRTKLQLARALNDEAGITVDPLRPMDELKEIANTHGISLQYAKAQITEGWSMKPKGLLQILWERGWINPSECMAF